MRQGERQGIGDARVEVLQQRGDKGSLAAESSQEGEIGVDGLTGLAPSQHGEAADEAVPPSFDVADRLQIRRGADHRVHGRGARWKTRCCSTRPEVGLGARGATV